MCKITEKKLRGMELLRKIWSGRLDLKTFNHIFLYPLVGFLLIFSQSGCIKKSKYVK